VPVAILPLISMLGWPALVKWVVVAVEVVMLVYAFTLLPTKLVLSDDGLLQQQLFSHLRLPWTDIAERRYVRVTQHEDFWILDSTGKKHHLKRWLVFGQRRSKQVAEVLRQKGVAGKEEYDA